MIHHTNTKRALTASLVSLCLCFSMLIGSTFAWFTDTATTSVNTIQAGKLDIDLVDTNGTSVVNRSLVFKKADGHNSESVLWEPGCTYELEPVYVKNNGTLAVKYIVELTGIQGAAELNKVIEWTIDYGYGTDQTAGHVAAGNQSAITIKGHMKEDAGNEYQGLSITGCTIMVRAAQDTVEYDSNGNTYDNNAPYDMTAQPTIPAAPDGGSDDSASQEPSLEERYKVDHEKNTLTIYNASDFLNLAKGYETFGLEKGAADNCTVLLGKDINFGGTTLYEPIKCWWGKLDGQRHSLSNVNVNVTTSATNGNVGLFAVGTSENTLNIENLKLSNIHVTGSNTTGNSGIVVGYSANAVLKNITVENSSVSGAERMGGIVGQFNGDISGCTVKNTTITGGEKVGGIVGDLFAEGRDATLSDCHVDTITITATESTVGSIVGRLRAPNGTAKLDTTQCTATNVTGASAMYGVNLDNA